MEVIPPLELFITAEFIVVNDMPPLEVCPNIAFVWELCWPPDRSLGGEHGSDLTFIDELGDMAGGDVLFETVRCKLLEKL